MTRRRVAVGSLLFIAAACTPFGAARDTELNPTPATPGRDGAVVVDGGGGDGDAMIISEGGDASLAAIYRAMVLSDNPLAYYRFNETAGTTASSEISADTVNATIIGTVGLNLAGVLPSDRAFRFGDDGAVVEAPPMLFDFVKTDAFSIEAWFRPTFVDGEYRHVFIKDSLTGAPRDEYGVYFQTEGLTFERYVNDVAVKVTWPPQAIELNRWHHVVATYSGSALTLYLDGVGISQDDIREAGNKMLPFRIGAKIPEQQYGELLGAIDEVAIYGQALTAARVTAHYAAGKP